MAIPYMQPYIDPTRADHLAGLGVDTMVDRGPTGAMRFCIAVRTAQRGNHVVLRIPLPEMVVDPNAMQMTNRYMPARRLLQDLQTQITNQLAVLALEE